MTDIDYEALGFNTRTNCMFDCPLGAVAARAVVAALREQGMVVVRRDDLYHYLAGTWISVPADVRESASNVELFTRLASDIGIDAALRNQGFVVVSTEDAHEIAYQTLRARTEMGWDELHRTAGAICAALVALGDGEEGR